MCDVEWRDTKIKKRLSDIKLVTYVYKYILISYFQHAVFFFVSLKC
jgi:hypothetical protein